MMNRMIFQLYQDIGKIADDEEEDVPKNIRIQAKFLLMKRMTFLKYQEIGKMADDEEEDVPESYC